MIVIILHGWQDPRSERRVSLSKILQRHCSVSMHEAKQLLDRFVETGNLRIELEHSSAAAQFAAAANDIGLLFELHE